MKYEWVYLSRVSVLIMRVPREGQTIMWNSLYLRKKFDCVWQLKSMGVSESLWLGSTLCEWRVEWKQVEVLKDWESDIHNIQIEVN